MCKNVPLNNARAKNNKSRNIQNVKFMPLYFMKIRQKLVCRIDRHEHRAHAYEVYYKSF